jgi:hypothetical protein
MRVAIKEPLVRMYLVARWIKDQVCVHPERDIGDESFVMAARDQTSPWMKEAAANLSAWLEEEKWIHRKLGPRTELYAHLALYFNAAPEDKRIGVLIRGTGDPTLTLGIVKEAGQEEDYLLYNPMAGTFSRYPSLQALANGNVLGPLRNQVELYWMPKEEITPAAAAIVEVKTEPVVAPIRAKKPQPKKRAATTAAAAAASNPESPVKRAAVTIENESDA